MSPEPLYPVAEVAKLWRCSRMHIYDLIAHGHLRVVNISGSRAKTRIPQSSLDDYVRKHTRTAKESAA